MVLEIFDVLVHHFLKVELVPLLVYYFEHFRVGLYG